MRAAALFACALTAACSTGSTSPIGAAQDADGPACATALAAAPAAVAGLARTPLTVQGAMAWGEPPIVLRCGLPAQPPTTKPCLGIDGIDWIVDSEADPFVFISYGRTPAVELRVPARYGRESAVAAATDVGPVAAALPRNGRACIGAADVTPVG